MSKTLGGCKQDQCLKFFFILFYYEMNQNAPLNWQVYLKLILLSIINDQRNLKIATIVKLINKSLKQFRLLIKQTIEKETKRKCGKLLICWDLQKLLYCYFS